MMDSIQPYQSGLMNYQGFTPNASSSSYAEMQGTRVALISDQARDITIYTDEGDKVTLSSESSTLLYYSNYEGIFQEKSETGSTDDPGGQIANQESVAFQEMFFMEAHTSNISIAVEGDLNKEEIKDIQNVLKRMDKMMNRSLSGKGSAPRKNDNKKAYEDNWEKIFGNKEEKPEVDPADTTWDDLADD